MSNVRVCDYCGVAFGVHVHTYREIEMPLLDKSGYYNQTRERGNTNTRKMDVCGACLQAVREALCGRAHKIKVEGKNFTT